MAEMPIARSSRATLDWNGASVAPGRVLPPQQARPQAGRTQLPPTPRTASAAPRRKSARSWITTHVNLLRAADTALVAAAAAIGYAVSGSPVITGTGSSPSDTVTAAALAVGWGLALEVFRTRNSKIMGVGAKEYRSVAAATLRVFGLMAMTAVLFSIHGATAYIAVSLPVGLLLLVGNRWAFRRRLGRQKALGNHLSRAIVVGEAEEVHYVVDQMVRKFGSVYKVLGVCLPGARYDDSSRGDETAVPVLASTDDIVLAVKATGADAVIVAGPLPGGNRFIRELGWRLEGCPAELVLAATLSNVARSRVHWLPVDGLPLMHVDIPRYSGARHALKRVMDLAIALIALILLLPLLGVLAVVVALDSPGPVLFRQVRVGKDGRKFTMLKFRSMVADAEGRRDGLTEHNKGAGVLFKLHQDPRVTRCGRWLRRHSFDELPQLWNVLRGDMSLVGPRPPLDQEVDSYESHTRRRLLIKPGMTGLWQVNGRSDLPWHEAVRLDLYYVENWSIAGDLLILWRTFRAVIKPTGAY